MAIKTVDKHDLQTFLSKLRSHDDAVDRAGCYVSTDRWAQGKLDYAIEQLGKARKYLLHAYTIAVAQKFSVENPNQKLLSFPAEDQQ